MCRREEGDIKKREKLGLTCTFLRKNLLWWHKETEKVIIKIQSPKKG